MTSKYKLSSLDIVAVIAEGAAEQAVIEILYENEKLIFENLLEDEVIRTRSANKFADRYLMKDFDEMNLGILRVLDSEKENFILPKAHQDIPIFNVITKPEIEMLLLISKDCHADFKQKHKGKDLQSYLGKHIPGNTKSKEFWKNHFQDCDHLIDCINKYDSLYHQEKLGLSFKDILR